MQQIAQNDNSISNSIVAPLPVSSDEKKQTLATLKKTIQKLEHTPTTDLGGKNTNAPEAFNTEKFPLGHCHEIWAARSADYGAAVGYALHIAAKATKPILWVTTMKMIREHGMPYGPGLLHHDIDPAKLITVCCNHEKNALWAMEEGLKSTALAAVVGELTEIDLISSRRLSLACREHRTLSLLLLRRSHASSSACYSRWKIEPTVSNSNLFAQDTPGPMRLYVSLVKHKAGIPPTNTIMEWQHAQDRFPMATALADRTLDAREPSKHATG